VTQSPRITRLAWGKLEVEGLEPARDLKLWPGGGRPWDWRETRTHHVPGIQVLDVTELLDRGTRVAVLTRGMELALRTCPETLEFLEGHGLRFYVAETNEAAKIYNELAGRGEAVGGLFHSTC